MYSGDLMSGIDHTRRRDGGVDAAGHRCQYTHQLALLTPLIMPAARARSTTLGIASMTASISSSVEVHPSENRNDPRATSGSIPIANSTCDDCGTPAVHALPVETSMPTASSSNTNASPSHPGNETCAIPGTASATVHGPVG